MEQPIDLAMLRSNFRRNGSDLFFELDIANVNRFSGEQFGGGFATFWAANNVDDFGAGRFECLCDVPSDAFLIRDAKNNYPLFFKLQKIHANPLRIKFHS